MTARFKNGILVKNPAFGALQRFSAVWARLELLGLDIFPAPRFGAAVEQEILRSLCMHHIPVPPRAAANKQTFLLVKEREKKNTLHKVHQQMWPVNPTRPFLLIKRIWCICNVGVTSRFGEAGSAKTWQFKAAKSAELLHPRFLLRRVCQINYNAYNKLQAYNKKDCFISIKLVFHHQ